jgi:hypothetical protein
MGGGGGMFNLKFEGTLCVLTKHALKDIDKLNITELTVETIIRYGDDYRNNRTKKNERGRSMSIGGYLIFAKMVLVYSPMLDDDVWMIKHVGKRRVQYGER